MWREGTMDGGGPITRQETKAGDHVDLLALADLLAVPNVCGADVMRTSNFALKPIKLTVFQATDADVASVPRVPVLKSQRTPKDFRNAVIKANRELKRDPAYVAEFTNVPIVVEELAVKLDADEVAMLQKLRRPVYGDDDGAALRDILFTWWEQRFLGAAVSGAPPIGDR